MGIVYGFAFSIHHGFGSITKIIIQEMKTEEQDSMMGMCIANSTYTCHVSLYVHFCGDCVC